MKNIKMAENYKQDLVHPIFKKISKILEQENLQAFVIGGFVRDIILKRPSKDIDIVVLGSGIELATKVASSISKKINVSVFKRFGTAMFRLDDTEIEFVGARKESYSADSRNPFVEEGSLEDDQNRRDFTINALAISLNKETYGELLDPFNGISDMENLIIRTPLNPDITFSDDPLRMLRAIRFASQLGFDIDDKTFESLQKNKDRISIISPERITDELNKIILSPVPSIGFLLLDSCGLLELIFPELCKLKGVEQYNEQFHKDNFYHTLGVLDNISTKTNDLWLRWAAILHDIGKADTKKIVAGKWTFHGHEFVGFKMVNSIFRKMRLPMNEKMKYVAKLVKLHLRPIVLSQEIVSDSAVRRLIFDAGDDINDLMSLCESDITSKNQEKVKKFLANFQLVREKIIDIEQKDSIRNFSPPITGEIIMESLKMEPCREVGIIKNRIKDAIIDGEIPNTYEAAYDLMIAEATKLGISI